MIARSFIFLTALFSILTIVAGEQLEYDASKDYFSKAKDSHKQVEDLVADAVIFHHAAAFQHAKIIDERHRNASEAHARQRDWFITEARRLNRKKRLYWPPSNNKVAFDWHVENKQDIEEYRDSLGDAYGAIRHLGKVEYPAQANTQRNEALKFQPGKCSVNPFRNFKRVH